MILGGTMFAHDALRLDYCLYAALKSLSEACDEVVFVNAGSTDKTSSVVHELKLPNVRVIEAGWHPITGNNGAHLAELANLARSRLSTPYHFHLQADEVLYEVDYPTLRKYARAGTSVQVQRYNFWRDARTIAGTGHLCGNKVIRGAPTSCRLIGDAENIDPACGAVETPIRLFHVGFIRKREALIEKSIAQEKAFWGGYNPVFDRLKTDAHALDKWVPENDLIHYDGPWPKLLIPWLEERGRL